MTSGGSTSSNGSTGTSQNRQVVDDHTDDISDVDDNLPPVDHNADPPPALENQRTPELHAEHRKKFNLAAFGTTFEAGGC